MSPTVAFSRPFLRPTIWLYSVFCLTGLAGNALAQEKIQGWHGSLAEAQKASAQSGKPIFAVLRCVR